MVVNHRILETVKEKTKGQPQIRQFLLDLMEFEVEPRGWYQDKYLKILEKACKEAEDHAV